MLSRRTLITAMLLIVALRAADISSYVFVEFSPGDGFPYVVINSTAVEPIPIVYIMVERDIIMQEMALNTTMYLPQGVYLAIPKKYFAPRPPAPPPGVKGRVVDIEVEGLGVARVVIARNATEIPNAVAYYVYLDAEERGGRYYYRGKPLDVRRPKTPRDRAGGSAQSGEPVGQAEPMYYTETKSGTAVSSWARYVFNPASPINVRNPQSSSYTPVMYFNATGYANNDFIMGRTPWAYLGHGVSDIYLAIQGGSSSSIRYSLCPYSTPTPTPPASPTASPCVPNSQTAPSFGRYLLARISAAPYANSYLWFYAEIYNPLNRPINASIAVVYNKPAPSDGSVYSLLTANWLSSVGQPGYTFGADYGYSVRVSRLLFTVRIPPGAQMPINIALIGLAVYTCSSSSTLTLKIYTPADPNAYITATGQKYTSAECATYYFGDIYGTLPESAVVPLLAANSTVIPLIIEFNPSLYASYPNRVTVTFRSLFAFGQRWPEIWRHNANNWINSARTYPYTTLPVKVVFRDYLAFSVWSTAYNLKNESASPWTDVNILGYAVLTTQVGSSTGYEQPSFPRLSLQYIPLDQYLQLKKICLAFEGVNKGTVGALTTHVSVDGQSPWLEAFASIVSAVTNAIGNTITGYQIISKIFGLAMPTFLGPLGFAVWGLGVFAALVPKSGNTYCEPSSGWVSHGYDAGTGYIRAAGWWMSINELPPYTGGLKVKLS
ncbi:hypothetical protein, partial [Pyrobaculum aerophilum]|uniref:hypothetical protein n=1 Tax=Pyrobaculum aerophilum TaxID=13773 RepID=UPI002FD94231